MTQNVFSVPVFFVIFRETLETVVIVSILLAFLKQSLAGPNGDPKVYKKLIRQVWWGIGIALSICIIIGCGVIGAFYGANKTNSWSKAEYIWEGTFALVAAIMITVLGAALLRVNKMQEKWTVKLRKLIDGEDQSSKGVKGALQRWFVPKSYKVWAERYSMFMIPFITVLREGIEALVFIFGVTFSSPASSVPLAVVVGIAAGCVVGYLLYKGGASSKLQIFLIISTCILYLVAAGLFSRAVWYFQQQKWNNIVGGDAAEVGAGAGSYDIDQSVWHINFGNPELNGGSGWGIFNAILGWQNSATYGSVISYNLYWLVVIAMFVGMRYKEVKGHLPFMKAKANKNEAERVSGSQNSSGILRNETAKDPEKTVAAVDATPVRTIAE
ncbi:putative iron transferase [Halenospora varia]|nr:putative iron transferase [Halenospora varia]